MGLSLSLLVNYILNHFFCFGNENDKPGEAAWLKTLIFKGFSRHPLFGTSFTCPQKHAPELPEMLFSYVVAVFNVWGVAGRPKPDSPHGHGGVGDCRVARTVFSKKVSPPFPADIHLLT